MLTRILLFLVCSSPVVHPSLGTSFENDRISVSLTSRKQNYNWAEKNTVDTDINSPKSVKFHPYRHKFYVNSLEGGTTVVYCAKTGKKIKVINHKFGKGSEFLWAKSCGLYRFSVPRPDSLYFTGKPVESAFSHHGRYLWVPYYRRSFDINAQDPSAVAVIDTWKDTIVRLFETGPLPKMIAVSPDGKRLAISHWGNNTVGLMNIESENPEDWHYLASYVIDYKLKLNLPRNQHVNRDCNSGYCLRGTVFTPDNRYLLIACMGGNGGIAVIDLKKGRYLGRVLGTMCNMRHIEIGNGYLYASINAAGFIQRIPLSTFIACLDGMRNFKTVLNGWTNCKVGCGARTIVLSPDGRFIFAACNGANCISIVDASSMTTIGSIPADSFPVGMDISKDGSILVSTSQGRSGIGGNAVDIYRIHYK